LIKHSEQTLLIRFHSANRINQKRPFTASLYSYVTTLRRTTFFSTFRTHDSQIYCAATFDCTIRHMVKGRRHNGSIVWTYRAICQTYDGPKCGRRTPSYLLLLRLHVIKILNYTNFPHTEWLQKLFLLYCCGEIFVPRFMYTFHHRLQCIMRVFRGILISCLIEGSFCPGRDVRVINRRETRFNRHE